MLTNFHMYSIRFQHAREECESKRVYVFTCLVMFSLSGHCELLFLVCFIASWTLELW